MIVNLTSSFPNFLKKWTYTYKQDEILVQSYQEG